MCIFSHDIFLFNYQNTMRYRSKNLGLRSQELTVMPQAVPVGLQSLNAAAHVQFLYSQPFCVQPQALSAGSQALFSTSQRLLAGSQGGELVVRWQPRNERDTALCARRPATGACGFSGSRADLEPRTVARLAKAASRLKLAAALQGRRIPLAVSQLSTINSQLTK